MSYLDDKGKKALVTYDSPFLNTDVLFIEYDDVIKSPFFLFLLSIKDNEALNELFDLSEFIDLDVDSMYEWYINRKHKNIFKCLKLRDDTMQKYFNDDINSFNEWCNNIIYDSINKNTYFVDSDTELNFVQAVNTLLNGSLVKRYFIYTPIYSESIKNDIEKLFNNKIPYVYGDLVQVITDNKIKSNSTFVFSDIRNILCVEKSGVINYSSIVIADRYEYNYKDNETLVVDTDQLSSKYIFKLDFFDNINLIE